MELCITVSHFFVFSATAHVLQSVFDARDMLYKPILRAVHARYMQNLASKKFEVFTFFPNVSFQNTAAQCAIAFLKAHFSRNIPMCLTNLFVTRFIF